MPPRTDPRWIALVERPDANNYEFLALKILMQRVALKGRGGMAPSDRDAVVDEVFGFFQKNKSLMSKDISALFG